MQFAPDGRLFVCEQGGRLRVIENGVLLTAPFLTLTVSSAGERGLLGVAFDPNFATNQLVYVYYTATTPSVHNRISRFVANGNIAVPGSETIVFELDDLSSATNHNGGALMFGHDGRLYAAVGDNANGANAQSLNNLLGKMLRINADGTIPSDNPFFSLTTGRNRAIWALGLRNPFTFAFNPAGNEMFINDVGQNAWEEINDGIAGANYGWPDTEGPTSDPRFQSPRHAYGHSDGACAITGAAFYAPAIQFPSGYEGDYFFADYCAGWIRKLDPYSGNLIAAFASGISFPVDLKVAGDGALYYLARGTGASTGVVYRIAWVGGAGNQAPTAAITQPTTGTVYSGGDVITYAGTGTDPEDGTLPTSAFTWSVDFYRATNSGTVVYVRPFIPATTGSRTGSFTIPTTGETSADVWYRIHLTVRDSSGLTHSAERDVLPRKVRLTVMTSPDRLRVKVDEQPTFATRSFESVVGITRTLEAVSPQATETLEPQTYSFVSWSDGGAARHTISTPATDTTYTATYRLSPTRGTGIGLQGAYFRNIDLTGPFSGRTDPTVDFTWGAGSPSPCCTSSEADTFSVRWTGWVEAELTETYTFYTQSDDGVRLWVNDQSIVNNWTDHKLTENSGTISLIAGQRYPIRVEYYENTGHAIMRLLWSSATTPKSVVPSTRLYSYLGMRTIKVNFQPASAPVPSGYQPDTGLVFGPRGDGSVYGWNADNTAQTRDRNAANSPDQTYDTLAYMQKPGNPDAAWEIALPNDSYRVRVVAGDPSYFDNRMAIAVEDVLIVNDTTTSAQRWLEGRSATRQARTATKSRSSRSPKGRPAGISTSSPHRRPFRPGMCRIPGCRSRSVATARPMGGTRTIRRRCAIGTLRTPPISSTTPSPTCRSRAIPTPRGSSQFPGAFTAYGWWLAIRASSAIG
jgi:glucose/arabinose dehydrogenase